TPPVTGWGDTEAWTPIPRSPPPRNQRAAMRAQEGLGITPHVRLSLQIPDSASLCDTAPYGPLPGGFRAGWMVCVLPDTCQRGAAHIERSPQAVQGDAG